jgi:hypothetical protein
MSDHGLSTPEAVARLYLDRVIGRDADGLAALYAPDGYLDLPNGARIGAPAVRDFYTALFARGGPVPTPTNFIGDKRRCAVELVARMPDGAAQLAIDCFEIDESGRIASLIVYTRVAAG